MEKGKKRVAFDNQLFFRELVSPAVDDEVLENILDLETDFLCCTAAESEGALAKLQLTPIVVNWYTLLHTLVFR